MDNIKIIIETNAEQASKSFNDLSNSLKNTDTQAKDLRKEIKEMKAELFRLTPGTEEYAQKLQELGVKMNQLSDTTQELRAATGGLDTVFQTTSRAASSLMGGFSAVMGVMALFGDKSEDLQKTFVRLQAIMAIATGLKGLSSFRKETRRASISLKAYITQVRLATRSVIQQTTATSTLAATEGVATVATNVLRAAVNKLSNAFKNNPIGIALIALTALVTLLGKVKSEVEAAQAKEKEYNDVMSKRVNYYKDLNDYYSESDELPDRFENVDEQYSKKKEEFDAYINRLKQMGIQEEELNEIMRNGYQDMLNYFQAMEKEADGMVKRIEDAQETADDLRGTWGTTPGFTFKKQFGDLDYLRKAAKDAHGAVQELGKALSDLAMNDKPSALKNMTKELQELSDAFRIDIAGGSKTQGEYIQAQIDAYQKAYDNLFNENGSIKGRSPRERRDNLGAASVFKYNISRLEVDLAEYNAGLQKKANDEAKKAAEALNKNFKKISQDISDKASEYQEAWLKALKNFADLGNYTGEDALLGTQSLGRAITEMNRYSMQLDEYVTEWKKNADKALAAGEISRSQYDRLIAHIKQTQENMVSGMKDQLNVFMTDDFFNSVLNIQNISEGFKKQNENMLNALAGGLITREEYHNFLVARKEEYKQEIETEMPRAREELAKSLAEAVAQGKNEDEYRQIYESYLENAGNIIPPSVIQQINTSLKEVFDKEFEELDNLYEDEMNNLKRRIQEDSIAWMNNALGQRKSKRGLMTTLLFGQGENPSKTYETAQRQAQEIFDQINKEAQAEIEWLQTKQALLDQDSDQYQAYADKIRGIQQNLAQAQTDLENAQVENAKDYADRIYDIASNGFDSLSGLASAMGSYYAEQKEQAKDLYGKNSAEYQKYLEREGAMKIAQVWSDWAMGVMAAWAANAKYGVASYVLAALQTAALTATAITSTQQIRRQTKTNASGNAPANVGQLTDRVIMADAQRTDQTAQLNAQYNQGATRVYVTQGDIQDANNENRVAVTQNKF